MLFPLRVIRRIHREGFRCIPEAIRFRIALHRQRPFLQTETALRQAEEDAYQAFIRRHEAPLSAPFTPTMRLSFLIPTYNTPPELLRALADSLLAQTHGAWEACTRELLQALTQEDNRFRVTFGAENRGIAGNTNAALTMATGEFVALCDHDDLLAPDAVRCILEAAQDGADFVYTDEDKVSADGTHFFEPHLKPDFAPDSLRSGNYICHITAASRALMNAVGGLRPGFDGSQDHDLALRLSENATKITHIPRILYHWRMLDTSFSHQKAQTCADAAARAVADQLRRLHMDADVTVEELRVRIRWKTRPMRIVCVLWGAICQRSMTSSAGRTATRCCFCAPDCARWIPIGSANLCSTPSARTLAASARRCWMTVIASVTPGMRWTSPAARSAIRRDSGAMGGRTCSQTASSAT